MIDEKQDVSVGMNSFYHDEGNICQKAAVPYGIEKKLSGVDWTVNDVLVGSFGSVNQFRDNLERNYYYVPAQHVTEDKLPVNHVALYQSKAMFGRDAGIRYYGKVTETKILKRKEINFPLRRNNGDELYYAFKTEEWKTLPVTLDVQYETVREPKFTNMFLLNHCSQSYELFCIRSSEQFLLFHELNQLFGYALNTGYPQFETVRQFGNGKSVWIHNNCIDVFDENGDRVFDRAMKLSDFEADPKKVFMLLADKLI